MFKRIRNYLPDYRRYEQLKRDWIAAYPNSTPQQYHDAMRRIAKLCGV